MFRYKSELRVVFVAFAMMAAAARADVKLPDEDITLIPHAYGHFMFGQVSHATGIVLHTNSYTIEDLYTENAYTGFSFEAWYKDQFKMVFGIEVSLYFSWPQLRDRFITKYARQDVNMGPTYGSYVMNETALGDFHFDVGYFNYKYNPDVRNLGEYLFRSATYPAYIITHYDSPSAKLLGARVNHAFLENSFSHDIILSSETSIYPAMDWSLSYLAGYDIANLNFIEVGAGITLSHLISVYNGNYDDNLGSLTDPVNDNPTGNRYITADGDTAYYTFRANKLMGRASIDPKFLIPGSEEIFGSEDLKVYVEAVILGTKSYPDSTPVGQVMQSYARWQEKMPVTFGVNLPAFGIMDVFNLEFEHTKSKYLNDYYDVYIVLSLPNSPQNVDYITKSYWKWSVYTKKTFLNKHLAVTAQAARDHMRLYSAEYGLSNLREMLIEAGDWWWTIKTSYEF